MTLEEIKERLAECQKNIDTIVLRWESMHVAQRLSLLQAEVEQQGWSNPEQYAVSLKKIKQLQGLEERYNTIVSNQIFLVELASLADDLASLSELGQETRQHVKHVGRFKIAVLLDREEDDKNCFFHVNSGAGGTEAQDWAEMLLRMYMRFCEHNGLHAEILDYQSGEGAGMKSATVFIKGDYAYGLLSCEEGVHRLVRISPYDANKRRHTSFAAVNLTPEVPDISITINPVDLRIDTYRAGGAGGQHVNKTDSAVRITHMPSGIVVQCQNERSQLQNKETAMKMLKARLYQKEKEEREAEAASLEKKKIEWGSQIRSYVLHPYKMVKDHRTDYESPQPEKVLDGEIMDFIEACLISR